jgi:hypothetical protein
MSMTLAIVFHFELHSAGSLGSDLKAELLTSRVMAESRQKGSLASAKLVSSSV